MDQMLQNMDPAVISQLMSDPEVMRILSDPSVMAKVQRVLEDPTSIESMRSDADLQYLINVLSRTGAMNQPSAQPMPNPWATPSTSQLAHNPSSNGEVINIISRAQFDSTLSENPDRVVVVDYTASWCGPCRHISPAVVAMAKLYANRAVFIKVDVDRNKDIAQEKQIRSMPTFHFYVNTQLVEEFSGADSAKLEATVDRLVERYSASSAAPKQVASPYKNFPLIPEELVSFTVCKFDMVRQKIDEFASNVPECSVDAPTQSSLSGFIELIEQRSMYHRSKVTPDQIQAVKSICETWPPKYLPPMLNLLRMSVLHPSFFSAWVGQDGIQPLVSIIEQCRQDHICVLTILRSVCNMMTRYQPRLIVLDHIESLINSITSFFHAPYPSQVRTACVSVLINLSIVCLDSKMKAESVQDAKLHIVSLCAHLIQEETDPRLLHRLILVIGTCMYRDAVCASVCASLSLEDTINMVLSASVIDHSGQDAARELLQCIHDMQ